MRKRTRMKMKMRMKNLRKRSQNLKRELLPQRKLQRRKLQVNQEVISLMKRRMRKMLRVTEEALTMNLMNQSGLEERKDVQLRKESMALMMIPAEKSGEQQRRRREVRKRRKDPTVMTILIMKSPRKRRVQAVAKTDTQHQSNYPQNLQTSLAIMRCQDMRW